MNKRNINIIACSFALLLLYGCIHEYPEEMDIQPTSVIEVELDVLVNEDLLPLPDEARTRSIFTGYERRFIIDVYREGKVIEEKRIVATQAGESAGGKFFIPVSLKLDALKYTLVAWADYVEAGTNKDLGFITTNLGNIPSVYPYPSESRLREAFYGTEQLDLTSYRNIENARTASTINMQRTHAHYRIVTTDVDEFREMLARQNMAKQAEEYHVKVMYQYYFPTAFDAVAGTPCGSDTGVGFSLPFSLQSGCGSECEMISDYIPANDSPLFITLTMELTDAAGKLLSRTQGIKVPYKRGCTTTVSGRFLTTMMSGGIGLDAGYEGEYNIDISDFIK